MNLKKTLFSNIMLLIAMLLSILTLSTCTERRIFEQNIHLEEHRWHIDSVLSFSFEITEAQVPYDIYLNMRYAHTYPYYNLYLFSQLNRAQTNVQEELKSFTLFDPHSGEPQGSGSTEIFFLQSPLWTDYRFPAAGKYTLQVRQYMRIQTLEDVMDMGLRIEKSP